MWFIRLEDVPHWHSADGQTSESSQDMALGPGACQRSAHHEGNRQRVAHSQSLHGQA